MNCNDWLGMYRPTKIQKKEQTCTIWEGPSDVTDGARGENGGIVVEGVRDLVLLRAGVDTDFLISCKNLKNTTPLITYNYYNND